ncbi:arylsulfatase [Synoicihabitans lomoniglobus]|uniref:Arylsulfatase n=1 Tax=Synoicihabitans lomoniglobus TaxID=2909285 RepID=A0AAF0CM65_9BACT|nr:arylsulfatase [Opitutaceae bacterium LMO-M01]WED63678.1 arylsulfatase [Opitutaceae bacterium LMO-M01]
MNVVRSSAFVWFLGVFGGLAAMADKPNIVMIVADDLGFSDLGAYGGEIDTPNLDRLAAEGARFTQFYNNAVCVVTRASLYTGRYPRQGQGPLLDEESITLAEALQEAGYATSLIGKWHLGDAAPRRPIDRGFASTYGVLSGACNFFDPNEPDPEFYAGNPGHHRPFVRNGEPVTSFPPDYYTTDAFSTEAVDRIESAAAAGRPFFVNLCYTAPHFPLQAPADEIARQKGRYAEGYDVLRERRYARLLEIGIIDADTASLSPKDPSTSDFRYDYDVTPWEVLAPEARAWEERRMEIYAAMVVRMDRGIGEVMAALNATGQRENTIVMFFSDNGGCASMPEASRMDQYMAYNASASTLGAVDSYEFVGPGWGWAQNAPFRRHKVWNYEGGICTPMIVRWPGALAAGEIRREIGHVVDLMPTLLALAGAELREENEALSLEGRNLLPVWRGEQSDVRSEPLCWELFGNRAVRDGRWKLVWSVSAARWELYDLETDRSETRDLAASEPAQLQRLAAVWQAWAEQVDAPRP